MNRLDENVSRDGSNQAARGRRLVLALVLGLLGTLLVIMTANAYVAKRTQDTLLDFDRGRFFYTGLLDIPPDIHSVQLLPVGLTGEWDPNGQPLPLPLADMAASSNGDVIYVIGGTTPSGHQSVVHDGVYTSIMTGVKGVLTPWFQEPALPAHRTGAAAAVHRGTGSSSTLYVVGGLGSGQWPPTNTVFRAQIDNTTGHIVGDWTTDAQTVPTPLFYASAVVYGDYLYVIGGNDGAESFDSVYYAAINPDGSLGPFTPTSPLPGPASHGLFDGYAVVYDGVTTDTLYYVGGMYIIPDPPPGEPNRLATEEVYFADFESSGELSAWTRSDGALPRPLYAHSGVLIRRGEILSTGGIADPLDPFESFTSTVQAALVDPNNPSFRLFNWCDTVPDPENCTIGAWLTGKLMPDVRALHGAVTEHGYVYVLGGMDADQHIVDTVFFGTINGEDAAAYAPEGMYRSEEIDLEQPATLNKLVWHATIETPGQMGLTMKYQTSSDGAFWSGWSTPQAGEPLTNVLSPQEPTTNIRFVQYEVEFTTAITYESPRLDWVEIYYEVPDPDVTVSKTTELTRAQLDSPVEYTILYTNTGGWVAENVVLTETLPENTTYAGDAGWHQVGNTREYTHAVGDLERGANGSTTFPVRVYQQVPPGVYTITNRIDIDYPLMRDELDNPIRDGTPDNNWYILETPLALTALTVTKSAVPAPGTQVTPGSYITYTLRYTNVGNLLVSEAVLTDTFDPLDNYVVISPSLPPGTRYYTWDVGPLAPRAAGEKTVVVQLNDPLPNNWLVTNSATLSNPQGDPYSSDIYHTTMNSTGGELDPIVDLTITDVQWQPSEPQAGEWPKFNATVANTGTADAVTDFWIALYIKPYPSDPPQWPGDHDRGYCLNNCLLTRYNYLGYVSSLDAGTSKEVLFEYLAQDPSPDFPALGFYDIYAQADVAFEEDNTYWGKYPEDHEGNNIWQGSLEVSLATIYLPAVFKEMR